MARNPSLRNPNDVVSARPSWAQLPAEAALSFLKDMKGAMNLSIPDLMRTININRQDAAQVLAIFATQGYVRQSSQDWITTPAGDAVSGARVPRLSPENVKKAVEALRQRIKQNNKDAKAAFEVSRAVAFGDFLLNDRARVQAADVGIGLIRREGNAVEKISARDAKAEEAFLRMLRGKTALLSVKEYQEWMGKRSHLDLVEQ
jgi:hypothetical protein